VFAFLAILLQTDSGRQRKESFRQSANCGIFRREAGQRAAIAAKERSPVIVLDLGCASERIDDFDRSFQAGFDIRILGWERKFFCQAVRDLGQRICDRFFQHSLRKHAEERL
jgi:hypothetical protein